jgi:acyl transferase domain-containing protein/acyl carrier protein
LGSVKSNIGHCMTAAGIAGFIKLVLALKHKQLPPTINYERLNEHIELKESPFYVNSRLQGWEPAGAERRQAAISSFGFSGTNAHMVIGEYRPPAKVERPVSVVTQNTKIIVPLSARTAEQLKQKARDLLDFIHEAQSIDLIEMAYTLQVGRQTMDERLGFVVSSIEQLAEKLQAYLAGERVIEDMYQGQVKRNNDALSLFSADADLQHTIDRWIANRKLTKLVELWVKGLEVDWSKLYGEVKPRRVSLPTYPFAKERYWLETAAVGRVAAIGVASAILHPLLHSNTSDLSKQRYRSTFIGEEFFLADHRFATNGHAGQRALPAVAYLEMARVAIEHALPAPPESAVLELHNTVWAQPIVVAGKKQVSISLAPSEQDEVDYEIYSQEADEEIVHCQGRAVLSRKPAPARLDLEQLKGQMGRGQLEPESVYAACAHMGLVYGPAFQAITGIYQGSGEFLVQLRLPGTVKETLGDYVLHPSLMDGVLQAAVGLIGVGSKSTKPRLPVALDLLRIVSPCTPEMIAWVRYAPGSQVRDEVVKLDIDLCDERGEVCIELRGLSSRALSKEIGRAAAGGQVMGSLLVTPVWQASGVEISAEASQVEYSEHYVVLCELSKVKVDQLESWLPQTHCLSLRAGERENIAQRYSEYALACFERIQSILQGQPQGKVLVQIVVADQQEQALFAGLSGLLKTAALENPRLMGQLILIPADTSVEDLARHLREEKSQGVDRLIRYEESGRQVLGWQEVAEEEEEAPIGFKEGGVYLITGGMGGLGQIFAREILAKTCEARVILTGRSALSAEKRAQIDRLSGPGGRVSYRQVDVGDLDQVKQLIAAIKEEYGELSGILHSAGMIADNFILKKSGEQFSEVLAPKVRGGYNLDQASQDVELDFFVLFSSVAGAMGNVGQADYAVANGFLDWFAWYRNRQVAAKEKRGRTRSINWPLWEEGGMHIDRASKELLQQTTGMQPMRTATGLRAFYRSLALPYDQMLVVEGDLSRITTRLQKARMFEPLSNTETSALYQCANAETEAAVSLDQLQRQLKTILATVLRVETSIIDVDQPFAELGVDSFLGAELVVAINRKYGTALSHNTLFDYPTVREFSLSLEQEIKKSPGYSIQLPAALPVRPPVPAIDSYPVLTHRIRGGRTTTNSQAHSDDKIAIVGMSGRYPQANNLKQYWENLAEGKNSIVEVPASRWDVNRYYDPDRVKKDKTNSKWLGALDDIDCFDPLFFRISPHEAEYMDPQHRLFLQESYRAFEDAGYSSNSLSNKKCGVYLGISTNEYMSLLLRNGIVSVPVTSNNYAIAAARIAYYLNLKGPAIAVDTACSSSLVAIHLASQALSSREIDMALAGGVSLWLISESYIAMSQAGMFSPVGQCKTFDDTADGIVNGEGVGVLVLKRLKDAQEDNDFIYGVILGSGINQDGRTNGITAPSVNSQIELEREIYAKHKIDPETISYVEMHGTGTKLGDPIELEALATVFKEKAARKNYCGLGSVKSNIGHTTAAAGVAGVQKVLLSMQHRTLVPSLNVTKETSRFDFNNSPFYIVREKQTWDAAPGSLRRAAVSSFGFSGTNAHLVVEEYLPPPEHAARENGPFIVPLTARTAEQLEEKARDLLEFVRESRERGQPAEQSTPSSKPIDLAAVAYTLQVGRDAMEERLVFVVSSVDQLVEKLSAYINGERDIESVYQGRVEPGNEHMMSMGHDDDMQEVINRWIARKKFAKLGQWWTRGLNIDWNKLYGEVKPRRVSLPAYPFAKERYWIDETPVRHGVDSRFEVEGDLKSIDDIMGKICDDAMETDQAVKLLKALV